MLPSPASYFPGSHSPGSHSLIAQSPYQSYVYGYPHKTAYRPLTGRSLGDIWADEPKDSLFLYMHIPFCEMRCGFCNLFTTVNQTEDVLNHYIQALEREAGRVKSALGSSQVTRFALGGGTPTHLSLAGLEAVLRIAEMMRGASLADIPAAVEVSPETATLDKLKLLHEHRIDRISMGVQSFVDSEALRLQRRQTTTQVQISLERIRRLSFPILNLDLIYGIPGQTIESWQRSLRMALQFQPEELYLYPLYVRPLTGLGIRQQQPQESDRSGPDPLWDEQRLTLYRVGREVLLGEGYTQVSMRMFRAAHAPRIEGPVYCCQADGMLGLGCGARSYTRSLHYSRDYAVNDRQIQGILADYLASEDSAFETVNYGFELNQEEQQRRFILLSLLSEEGLNLEHYHDRFASNACLDFIQLDDLREFDLAYQTGAVLKLTALGLERSDVIGPWLFSETVRSRMMDYQLK